MMDWNSIFEHAHEFSWPTASLSIQNRNPSPHSPGSRNMFKEDKVMILESANKSGYRQMNRDSDAVISFIKVLTVQRIGEIAQLPINKSVRC